jgi:large subunit ribosomal protein L20
LTRITSGPTRRRRHKKLLRQTKGHRGVRHRLYRRAHESVIHALQYSYIHRRKKKGDTRRLWNIRINAAARQNGLSYSNLVHGLKLSGAAIDRKMLAELAVEDPQGFAQVVRLAHEQLEAAAA